MFGNTKLKGAVPESFCKRQTKDEDFRFRVDCKINTCSCCTGANC